MNLLDRLTKQPEPERNMSLDAMSLDAYVDQVMQFGGWNYLLGQNPNQSPPGIPTESPPGDFESMVNQIYKRNGVVAGCLAARMMLFTEARFKFRQLSDRKVFGNEALGPLERPWPNGSTGELLARMEQDGSLAGNFYCLRVGNQRLRLRPDWVHIVVGTNTDYDPAEAPDATVVGYVYWPGGQGGKYKPKTYLASEVGHYAPIPDPTARFRGMSWLTPVIAEVDTDRQLTAHKAKIMEKGTPAFAIKYPETFGAGADGPEKRKQVVEGFKRQHEGVGNAWNALHLFGGADPVTLGLNFRDLDYKAIQGAGETRIAMAARVPAPVLGISEGLAGSALNAGNFSQARRQFGEQYAYPHWRMACEALAPLIQVPQGAELWYDTTDVAFLHEDAKDAAEVIATQASAIRNLTDGGYKADSVVAAVTAGDLTLLEHTNLVPVQLQPPGANTNGTKPSAPALAPGDN